MILLLCKCSYLILMVPVCLQVQVAMRVARRQARCLSVRNCLTQTRSGICPDEQIARGGASTMNAKVTGQMKKKSS